MFRAFILGALSALIVIAGLLLPASITAQQANLDLRQDFSQPTLPSSGVVKNPRVGAASYSLGVGQPVTNLTAVGGYANDRDAHYWEKINALGFDNQPQRLGDGSGNALYHNASVSVSLDGTVTYAWSEGFRGRILAAQKAPGGVFSAPVQVAPAGTDRAYIDVAGLSDGTVVVAWSENSRFRYVHTPNFGTVPFSATQLVSNIESLNQPRLAIGRNANNDVREIAIAFSGTGQIFAGRWNGSGFDIQQVSRSSNFAADPDVAIGLQGQLFVAWRTVEGGYYFSARQSDGTWPISKLSDDTLYGPAAIEVDLAGNIIFAWTVESFRLRIAYQSAAGGIQGPFEVSQGGLLNPNVAISLDGRSQIHIAAENFDGGSLRAAYFQFSAQGAGSIGAQPVIENERALFGRSSTVRVAFTDVSGSPTQVRWNWNAPPTDANPWETFQATINVPIPNTVNTSDCFPETLYTQVRNGNLVETTPKQDAITIDNTVTALVQVSNPYLRNISPVFTSMNEGEVLDLSSNNGATHGDPSYTRTGQFYLEINGAGDCADLKTFQVANSDATLSASKRLGIVDDFLATGWPLPSSDTLSDGPVSIVVEVTDQLENTRIERFTLNLDRVKPVLESGALTGIQPNPQTTILSTLVFNNVTVVDSYPDDYWGVWVANSLEEIQDPLTNTSLDWEPVEILPEWRNNSNQPSLPNWSLASGLGLSLQQLRNLENPTFYVYVRFLDGAGNPTDTVLTQSVTLETVTLPEVSLPLIRR
jgi:hypothetical protein